LSFFCAGAISSPFSPLYKRPLVEENVCAGVSNNVLGTLSVINAAKRFGVKRVMLISTDKAVRPTNIMGASKRICELLIQSAADTTSSVNTIFSMVRFGNVLGSSGSVIPLFHEQIHRGGPVTVTHPSVTRYFMTIPEAVQLVLQSTGMARGGDVFILDMGEPVRIADLARQMIELSGLRVRDESTPDGDISIEFTGLRPGEKLYEELLISANDQPTGHPLIRRAKEPKRDTQNLYFLVNQMIEAEVEKRIEERSLKENIRKGLTKRVFPEDDQDDDERFKALYQERLEKVMQADEKMKEKKEDVIA
jgi:FlaA1/EpsC-like NDP-sugar epimerase